MGIFDDMAKAGAMAEKVDRLENALESMVKSNAEIAAGIAELNAKFLPILDMLNEQMQREMQNG